MAWEFSHLFLDLPSNHSRHDTTSTIINNSPAPLMQYTCIDLFSHIFFPSVFNSIIFLVTNLKTNKSMKTQTCGWESDIGGHKWYLFRNNLMKMLQFQAHFLLDCCFKLIALLESSYKKSMYSEIYPTMKIINLVCDLTKYNFIKKKKSHIGEIFR